jgi:hypothetical protein
MRNLERANTELRRVNARLARERLGVADTAAGSLLAKVDRLASELEVLRAERSAEAEQRKHQEWIADLHRQIEFHRDRASAIETSRPWRAWMRVYRLRMAARKKLFRR